MFNIDVAEVVCYLRTSLLPRSEKYFYPIEVADQPYNQRTKYGLHVSVDLRMSDYGFAEDGNTRVRDEVHRGATAHFLFCGNTTVFFALSGSSSIPGPAEFKNTSNHDSCWRTDGVHNPLTALFFKWCEEVSPHRRPCDVDQHCGFLFGGHEFVEMTYQHGNGTGYGPNTLINVRSLGKVLP